MKRIFKQLTLLAVMLLMSASVLAKPKFWTWTGYEAERDWHAYFAEMKDIGITGIILGANKAEYEHVIPIAKSHGIDIYAWLWIMNNRPLAAEHPEWLDYNRNGESIKDKKAYVDYYKFLNPAIPEVQEAIVKQVEEIASIKGLKGISLDYCRYVDAILPTTLWKNYDVVQDKVYAEWDYGYHPYMLELFQKEYGYDPREQEDVNADKKWHQFRMDKVNEVVFKLDSLTKKYGIELTASPFPTPEMSRRMVYQDWGAWPLDRAFAMIYDEFYHGDLEWIADNVSEARRDMDADGALYFGLYAPGYANDRGFDVYEAMDTAIANGAEGIAFFAPDELIKSDKDRLKAYIKKTTKMLKRR